MAAMWLASRGGKNAAQTSVCQDEESSLEESNEVSEDWKRAAAEILAATKRRGRMEVWERRSRLETKPIVINLADDSETSTEDEDEDTREDGRKNGKKEVEGVRAEKGIRKMEKEELLNGKLRFDDGCGINGTLTYPPSLDPTSYDLNMSINERDNGGNVKNLNDPLSADDYEFILLIAGLESEQFEENESRECGKSICEGGSVTEEKKLDKCNMEVSFFVDLSLEKKHSKFDKCKRNDEEVLVIDDFKPLESTEGIEKIERVIDCNFVPEIQASNVEEDEIEIDGRISDGEEASRELVKKIVARLIKTGNFFKSENKEEKGKMPEPEIREFKEFIPKMNIIQEGRAEGESRSTHRSPFVTRSEKKRKSGMKVSLADIDPSLKPYDPGERLGCLGGNVFNPALYHHLFEHKERPPYLGLYSPHPHHFPPYMKTTSPAAEAFFFRFKECFFPPLPSLFHPLPPTPMAKESPPTNPQILGGSQDYERGTPTSYEIGGLPPERDIYFTRGNHEGSHRLNGILPPPLRLIPDNLVKFPLLRSSRKQLRYESKF